MTLGEENVGVLLYRNIFTIAPGTLSMFSFKDESDLYNSDKLKESGVRIIQTVG